jgi:signal transduction histidine kinase
VELETLGARGDSALRAAESGAAVADEFELALPLKTKGRVVGALKVERAALTEEDRQLLEAFATAAALAIDGTLSKTDFVSTVTHELRLPMTSIKGYSDLIRGGMAGPVSDMQRQLLDTVRSNVDWMNALVSDLGDIAKLETGRLKLDIEAVDTAACLKEALTALQPQIEAKPQTLTLALPDSLPRARADAKQLTRVFTYLITNAHRYTPANGQITLPAETRDSVAQFSVADTGVGMAPDDFAKLFTQFFRSEDPVVRDHKGWGLAVHLAQKLVEAFGGQMGAESEYQKGSRFWFTLPLA